MDPDFAVVVISDKLMLPGVHVALLSALEHWKGSAPPSFLVFLEGASEKDREKLRNTLNQLQLPYSAEIREISADAFHAHKSLHGSHMNYCRLLLPSLLPGIKRALYIDADVLVLADLSKFNSIDMKGLALGAVAATTHEWSIDQALAVERNIPLESPYFNNGVLLFDLEKWRECSLLDTCMNFMETHHAKLLSHEQTVLNHVFHGNFHHLPLRYNRGLPPDAPVPTDVADSILHFWGSPKPFDALGSMLHLSYDIYSSYLCRTRLQHSHWSNRFSPSTLKRTLLLAGPYAHQISCYVRRQLKKRTQT